MLAIGIIDCQKDFMNKDGALYVPNSETIKEKIKRLIKKTKAPLFFTADEHDGTEPEMKVNGGLFPIHCMKQTVGQQLIINPENRPVFTKRCYNVFDEQYGNKDIKNWLFNNSITEVDLCGVVGNICVEAATMGLIKLNIKTTIITNAVVWMDLGENNNEATSKNRMACAGVKFI